MLVCWIAGSGARVVDQLEDEEVSHTRNFDYAHQSHSFSDR